MLSTLQNILDLCLSGNRSLAGRLGLPDSKAVH